jgi:arsenate reductase (thioredoxin)
LVRNTASSYRWSDWGLIRAAVITFALEARLQTTMVALATVYWTWYAAERSGTGEEVAVDEERSTPRADGFSMPAEWEPHARPMVVFLCVQNAGRSQMAAGWMQHLAGDNVEVYSGGSDPASVVNPAAVEAMAEVGIDISNDFPKPWTDEVVRAADVIVTMGCGDSCPIFPGKRYLDWEVDDPKDLPFEQVRPIRDDIGDRVRAIIRELGIPARPSA